MDERIKAIEEQVASLARSQEKIVEHIQGLVDVAKLQTESSEKIAVSVKGLLAAYPI